MRKALFTVALMSSTATMGLNADAVKATPTTNEIINLTNASQINGVGITIKGNALYMKTTSDKAIVGYEVSSNGSRTLDGKTLRLNGKESWGFDAGLRAQLGMSNKYELSANWFYLITDLSCNASVPSNEAKRIFPTLTAIDTSYIDAVSFLSSNSKILFNLIDLNLHRRFEVANVLEVDPYIGIAGGFIRLGITEVYMGGDVSAGESNYGVYKSFYTGLGLNSGVNTKWKMGAGFSFIGNLAYSILYGNYNLDSTLLDNAGEPRASGSSRFHAERANISYSLGVNWDHFFSNNKWYISLNAAWMQRIFFDQLNLNGLDVLGGTAMYGNLGVQGLVFGAKLGF